MPAVWSFVEREFRNRPLLPVTISMIIGLWLGSMLSLAAVLGLSLGILPLTLFLLHPSLKAWRVYLPCLSILLFAPLYFHLPPLLLPANHISRYLSAERVDVEGVLYTPPEYLTNRVRLFLEATSLYQKGQRIAVTGKVRITVYELGGSLSYRDTILVRKLRLRAPRWFWNPGAFDYALFLRGEGIYVIGGVSRWSRITLLAPATISSPASRLYRLRTQMNTLITASIPHPFGTLLQGMILGERGGISPEVQEAFRRSGTAHLLAISGLHIGFLALSTFWVVRWIWALLSFPLGWYKYLPFRPSRIAACCTIPLLLAYAYLVGGRVSTVRATIMVVVYLVALMLEREKDLYNTLALAGLVILCWNPYALFAVSFQLSFLAVGSIIFILQQIERLSPLPAPETPFPFRKRLRRKCGVYGVLTLFTTLATLPLIWWHFHQITPYAPLANFLVVPLMSIVLPLGLLSSLLALLIPLVSSPLFWLTSQALWGVDAIIRFFADLPWASLRVPGPRIFTMIVFYATLFLTPWVIRERKRIGWKILCMISGLLICIIWDGKGYYSHQGTLRVTFLDVGQSEATLVEFPNGTTMLIDGGGSFSDDFDFGEAVVAPFLWKKGLRKIDTVVVSHPHADHYKGLGFILDTFTVKQFWDNGSPASIPQYEALRARAETLGIYRRVEEPQHFSPDDFGGVRVQVLHPSAEFTARLATLYPPADEHFLNNRSLVLVIQYGEIGFLFTGDLEIEGEHALVKAYGAKLRATFLKAPHHGSRTSSSEDFLRFVHPEAAIFSVGASNWYGLPDSQILSRYRTLRSKIFRTDERGAIEIVTDGKAYTVRFYAEKFTRWKNH